MIHLAHVRDAKGADHWIRRRRRQLEANPVPMLVVGVSEDHHALQRLAARAGVDDAFFIDASSVRAATQSMGENVLLLEGRHSLERARRFIDKAHRSRRRLDILLVEDTLQPDLDWCAQHVDSFEAWA